MTFTPTSSNFLGHYYPYGNRRHLFGDDLASLHQPTKSMPSPLVSYFASDDSWGSGVFNETNAAQWLTSAGPHPSNYAFPVGRDNVPSLSSIFESAGNSGGQAILSMLGSLVQLVPIIFSPALSTSNNPPRSDPEGKEKPDKGKGKARAVDSDDTDQPGPEPAPMEDEVFADTIREAMTASRRAGSRVLSPDEAGPSGSFTSHLTSDITPPSDPTVSSPTHSSGSDLEQAEIDHAILISSIEHIENSLHTLRANFVFPTHLDFHLPSDTDSHVSSTSPTDEDTNGHIAAYLSITSANSTVLNFVRDLRGLLRQLDRVNSNNDMEADSMKEKLAGSIGRVLEDVESEVEEAIGKWISLQPTEVSLVGG